MGLDLRAYGSNPTAAILFINFSNFHLFKNHFLLCKIYKFCYKYFVMCCVVHLPGFETMPFCLDSCIQNT
jgi:hypothetical protein